MQYENHATGCQSGRGQSLDRLLNLLLPPRCVLCGLPADGTCICPGCLDDLPRAGCHCRQCGLPLGAGSDTLCGSCILHPPPFTNTVYPLQYLFPVNRLVQAFKFNRQLAAGRILARLMHEWIIGCEAVLPDLIVPVPLHTLRLFKRGFNQAYELSTYLSQKLGVPIQAGSLRRRRNTQAQSGLNQKQRRNNVRGAFYWRGRSPPPRHIAIVDDVMTTATTVSECARILKKSGARRVDVWVAARAIPPGQG